MASRAGMWCRSFSSSCQASTSKLSPLNKKVLFRQQKLERKQRSSLTASSSVLSLESDETTTASKKKNSKEKITERLPLSEAASLLSSMSPHTPNAAYELDVRTKPAVHVQLNALRGRVFLPHSTQGSKKTFILAVAPQGSKVAQAAKDAGADRVASDEIAEELLDGRQPLPDKLITTPDMLPLFTRNPQLARLLGPKGLMPSAKRGTVADDLANAVREARGALDWKGDPKGIVRTAIGRLRFGPDELEQNVRALVSNVSEVSQGGAKAAFKSGRLPGILRVKLSSTQGPGIELSDY